MFDQMIHTQNRNKFPEEELAKYYGRCVAWSFDGTQILASGPTYTDLDREIDRLGVTECVRGFVDEPDRPWWDIYLADPEAEAFNRGEVPPAQAG